MDAWIRNLMKSVGSSVGSSSSSRRRDEPEILLCKRRCASPVVDMAAARPSSSPATSAPRATACNASRGNNNSNNNMLSAAAAAAPSSPNTHRIANWDKKREKCKNCTHIYLKTLSHHPGFCSVDCKSNATYLDKVNRTIRAMKDAVEQRQQKLEQDAASTATTTEDDEDEEPVVDDAPVVAVPECAPSASASYDDDGVCDDDRAPLVAHTFAEFGLESRILDASNVEWAFSALY